MAGSTDRSSPPATRAALCAILLPDSAHIQEEQARFANERGFSKHHPALPLYTSDDAAATLPLFRPVAFDTPVDVAEGITAQFTPAGHILGSASVHLTITDAPAPPERPTTTTLLVSGDLGRGGHPLVPGPFTPPAADTVLVESTYGDSLHPAPEEEIGTLAEFINRTARRGGTVLIPAFAVDRTEVLLVVLRDLMERGTDPTAAGLCRQPHGAAGARPLPCRRIPTSSSIRAAVCTRVHRSRTPRHSTS